MTQLNVAQDVPLVSEEMDVDRPLPQSASGDNCPTDVHKEPTKDTVSVSPAVTKAAMAFLRGQVESDNNPNILQTLS